MTQGRSIRLFLVDGTPSRKSAKAIYYFSQFSCQPSC
jgi:hypothetical protein